MGDVVDLTVEILKDIRNEIRGTNERLSRLEEGMNRRLDEVNGRLDHLNTRVDHLIDFTGKMWRDHERRIRKIERTSVS